MLKRSKWFVVFMVVALLVSSIAGCSSSAGSTAPAGGEKLFYEGKTINLIVPNTAGKGMDTYARMIVPYIQKYSGAKNIIVNNITGAGGVIGINDLWNAKPDGLTIAFTSIPTIILSQLSEGEGVKYDATQFTYLGRASTEARILTVGGNTSIKSIEDIAKLGRDFKFPTQGTDEDFFTMAVIANSLGFGLKAITGYEGNADTALAVVKGDGDGHITAAMDAVTMIKEGDKRPILIIAPERMPEYPEVPTALEAVQDETGKASLQAIVNMLEMHRSFFGPPNMDEEATIALREAIFQALNDPELQAKAEQTGLPIVPLKGDEEQGKVEIIAEAGKNIVPILKAAVEATK